MILFAKDYFNPAYQNAIIDTKTTNHSFLMLAALYKQMGVKNYCFHLTLLNPALQGVDPFDPTLDENTKVAIGVECALNFWYYIREVARVPAQAGKDPIRFMANRGNIALYFSFFNSIDFTLIQPRQTGKSVGTDILMSWLMTFSLWNSTINMLTKDNALRVANVERLKQVIDLLPKYLVAKRKDDADNQQMVTYKTRENLYQTSVAQSSEAAALNVGRGMTSPIIHIDEAPFIKFIGTIIPALLASGTAAREEAERNGLPYANIFTTTAGKKDDRDGSYIFDLVHGGAEWDEAYFDLPDKAAFQATVDSNSSGKKPLINGTFSHRQLGKTDEWLLKVLAQTNAQGEEADRDFFNVWTSGTQSSPLSVKLNNLIKDSEVDTAYREYSKDHYQLRWLIPEEEVERRMHSGEKFIIGLDTSEAVGRDDIALVITSVLDLSVVGTARINETNTILFMRYVVELMVKYPNTILNIERKSTGVSFLDMALLELPKHNIDPLTRIYNRLAERAVTDRDAAAKLATPLDYRDRNFYEAIKTEFGFVTNKVNRQTLYGEVLQEMAKRGGGSVRSKHLSGQIRGLVVKNGRIDHAASGHDDMVIAWLLTGWTIMKGTNLHNYGINPMDCMSLASEDGKVMTEDDILVIEERRALREEIRRVAEEYKASTDDWTRMKLERRIKYLTSFTENDGGEVLSMDGVLRQSSDENEVRYNEASRQGGRSEKFGGLRAEGVNSYC